MRTVEHPVVGSKLFNLSPYVSAILFGALAPIHIGLVAILYFFFQDTKLEEIVWWTYVGAYGQLFVFWIFGIAIKNEGARLVYMISSMIAAVVPVVGNWVFLGLFIYEAATPTYIEGIDLVKYKYINQPDSRYAAYSNGAATYVYIVIKLLLFFGYSGLTIWVTLECLFPIYEWWWTLGRLADFIPYTRPSLEEVMAADVSEGLLPEEDSSEFAGFDTGVRFLASF